MPHKHKHQGRPYAVRVDVTLPGQELCVDRVQDEDVYVALRDAFEAPHHVGVSQANIFLDAMEGKGKFAPTPELLMSNGKPLKLPSAHSDPFVVDWDGDGALDLLSGCSDGGRPHGQPSFHHRPVRLNSQGYVGDDIRTMPAPLLSRAVYRLEGT